MFNIGKKLFGAKRTISPEEMKVLAEIGVELGLRLKDFGIDA